MSNLLGSKSICGFCCWALMVLAIFVLINQQNSINCQSGFSDFIHRVDQKIPLVGSCDRIVYRGVANCLSNYTPTKVSSKGMCCAHRKYHACINGLKDGHQFAVQTENCPPYSVSMSAIHRISDRLVGFPLSSCDKNSCKNHGSKPKRSG